MPGFHTSPVTYYKNINVLTSSEGVMNTAKWNVTHYYKGRNRTVLLSFYFFPFLVFIPTFG